MTEATEAISRGREARRQGDFVTARAGYAAAAAIYRDQHEALFYAHTIRHIADIYVEESQQESSLQSAKPLYEEAIEIYRSNLHTKILDLANTLRPYALLLDLGDDLQAARPLWEEARNLYASLRLDVGVDECNRHLSLAID